MAKLIKSLMRNTLFSGSDNLVSLDDHYSHMQQLLSGHSITGMLDAGASTGRISKRLLDAFPDAHVYSFEPNPMYRDKLDSFAASETRFCPQYMALSDHQGQIELQITESPGSTSLFSPGDRLKQLDPQGSEIKVVEQVELTTIDIWAAEQDVDLQIMKFDIQGAELQALRGAKNMLSTSTLLVYTEILFNPLYEQGALFSEIDLCLRESGFVLYNIYKPKSHNGLLMWANAIYAHAGRLGI